MNSLVLHSVRRLGWLRQGLVLPADDLLRDAAYRRLWSSILISSLGGQVTMLALPLTAVLLLHATPQQMGVLVAMEISPFVLLALPTGVWLDRVRKLPVYIAGELGLVLTALSVPLAWWLGVLAMPWMFVVAFVMGCVHVVAGSAAQIVLTQVVARERLVEAHARNALASSGAEVVGPGFAGALIKTVGAPLALLLDAVMLVSSVLILRGLKVQEAAPQRHGGARFWADLRAGVRFVRGTPLLVTMATAVGLWQMCHHAAVVVQILFATRTLGLSESQIGLAFVGLGVGTVLASALGRRLSSHIGPGPCLLLGMAVCGIGWLLLALAEPGRFGALMFAAMLLLFGVGAVLIFINFLALRQAATPARLLGRMTSSMRWLILLPAGPGALIGGWLGEHVSLRAALAFAGFGALIVSVLVWRLSSLRHVRALPAPDLADEALGAEAAVGALQPGAPGSDAAAQPWREAVDRVGDHAVQASTEQGARG
jgi:MFS family permease